MKVLAFNFSFPNQVSFSLITLHKNVPSKLLSHRNNTPYLAGEQTGGAISKYIFIGTKGKLCFTHFSSKNIARIANAVQVTICLLVSTSVF